MQIEIKYIIDKDGNRTLERNLTEDEELKLISTQIGDQSIIYIFAD